MSFERSVEISQFQTLTDPETGSVKKQTKNLNMSRK